MSSTPSPGRNGKRSGNRKRKRGPERLPHEIVSIGLREWEFELSPHVLVRWSVYMVKAQCAFGYELEDQQHESLRTPRNRHDID